MSEKIPPSIPEGSEKVSLKNWLPKGDDVYEAIATNSIDTSLREAVMFAQRNNKSMRLTISVPRQNPIVIDIDASSTPDHVCNTYGEAIDKRMANLRKAAAEEEENRRPYSGSARRKDE